MGGPLFYASVGAIGQNHGVFGVQQPPPQQIIAQGTGVCALVGQTSWGPSAGDPDALYHTSGKQNFFNTFQPLGMNRLNSAYLMALSASYPDLFVVRVTGATGTARSTSTVNKAGSIALVTLTLKWVGGEGDKVVATTNLASDGNVNHFNLTLSVSSAAGTTSETFENFNVSTFGTVFIPDLTNSILLGSVTILSNGVPTMGSWLFSGGSTGAAVTSPDYVGTQGAGTPNKGFGLLEGNDTLRHVFSDDPGPALRPAVNTGLLNHVNFLLDRTGYMCGPSGQSTAAVQLDVLSFVSTNVVYTDPWVYVYDDTTGAKQLIPSNFIAASLGANSSPSTSFAWRNLQLRSLMSAIVGIEFNRGTTKASNTALGISTIIPFKGGGFCFEAAKVTAQAASASTGNWTRTQMGIFIASSVEDALQSDVDQPNVLINQQEIMGAIDSFLGDLVKNQNINPNTSPYIKAYTLQTIDAANTQASEDGGNFVVAASIKIGSSMERIIFSITYGETVVITPIAA